MKRSRSGRHKLGVSRPGHLVTGPVSVAGLEGGGTWGHMDHGARGVRLRVTGLSLVAHCGVEAIIIRHIADSLHSAIREPHVILPSCGPGAVPVLCVPELVPAVVVLHGVGESVVTLQAKEVIIPHHK